MNKRDLINHLKSYGCEFLREGSRHSWWWNPDQNKRSSVPRHTEIRNISVPSPTLLNSTMAWTLRAFHQRIHMYEGKMINPDFIAPCGLYCGVCAIYIAHRDNNRKFKERLVDLYKGEVPGKGILPNSENLSIEDIQCRGCLSDERFMHCRQCEIRACTREKGYNGCHQCDAFPCGYIENFPMAVGKKVILRAVPYWREVGTEKWIQDEEARYVCPECGNRVFRGAVRCNRCKTVLDLD